MRKGIITKFVAVLLVLVVSIGLFTQVPNMFGRSFAGGGTGVELTNQVTLGVSTLISEDGTNFVPLVDGAPVTPKHFFRFQYELTKVQAPEGSGPEAGIAVGDYFKLPIPSIFGLLQQADLEALENQLNAQTTSFVAKFDSYVSPSFLVLTFARAYEPQEEVVFTIPVDVQVYMENQLVNTSYVLTVPLPGGITYTFNLVTQMPSNTGRTISMFGVRDPEPEINWTIDVNTDLGASEDMMVVRYDIPHGLRVDDVTVRLLNIVINGTEVQYTEGTSYTAVSDREPTGQNFFYEVNATGTQLLIKIPNTADANGFRNAFRIGVKTNEIPALFQPWLTEFSYTAKAGVYPDEATTDEAQAAITTAVVKYNAAGLIEKTAVTPQVNAREIVWNIKVNPSKFPLTGVVLTDTITNTVDATRPMTFSAADMELTTTDVSGATSTVALATAAGSGSWVDVAADGLSFTLHFADSDISGKTANLKIISRITQEHVTWAQSNYNKSHFELTFDNRAKLDFAGLPSTVSVQSQSIQKVQYGVLVRKTAHPYIGYGNNKFVTWNYYLNLAGVATGLNRVGDRIDTSNQEFILSSPGTLEPSRINIYHGTFVGSENGPTFVRGAKLTMGPSADYTLELAGDDTMYINFSQEITTPMLIQITTRIKPGAYEGDSFMNPSNFKNTALIGPGPTEYEFGRTGYQITSVVTKTSGAVQYSDRSIPYTLFINPLKAPMNNLVITDTLPEGLTFYGHSLKLLELRQGTPVNGAFPPTATPFTDYTLKALPMGATDEEANYVDITPATDDSAKFKAFKIYFAVPAQNTSYQATFKAFLDPDATILTDKYINTAVFKWAGDSRTRTAETVMPTTMYSQNGRLFGSGTAPIVGGDNDTQFKDKRIRWQLDLNYLGRNVHNLETKQFVLDGQELDPASIRIYTDTVQPDGNLRPYGDSAMTLVDPAAAGFRIVPAADNKSFQVYFYPDTAGAFELLSKPYRIVYETNMVGITRNNYEARSEGTFLDAQHNPKPLNLTASVVTFEKYNKFISKTGVSTSTSAITNWTIKLNESRSDLYELTIHDTFTPGLEPLANTFKLLTEDNVVVAEGDAFFEYFTYVAPTGSPTEERTFKLVLNADKAPITNLMYITYDMRLVEELLTSNNVSNKVSIEGATGTTVNDQQVVTIQQKYYTISVNETGINRRLVITKVDKDNNPIPNTQFRIARVTGNTTSPLPGTFITDGNGQIVVNNLRAATYRITEFKAADGFVLLPSSVDVQVTNANNINVSGNQPATITIVNDNARKIIVTKLDARTNAVIPNVTFELRSASGVTIATGTTDGAGKLTFDGVGAGTYYLREQTVSGYYPAEDVEVVIRDGDMVQVGGQSVKQVEYPVTVYNQPYRVIRILKTDTAGNPLSGTEFTMTRPNGASTHRLTTNANGVIEIVVDSLSALGEYRFVETRATDGYVMDPTPFSIDVQLKVNGNDVFVFERVVRNRPISNNGTDIPITTPATTSTDNATGGVTDTATTTGATIELPTTSVPLGSLTGTATTGTGIGGDSSTGSGSGTSGNDHGGDSLDLDPDKVPYGGLPITGQLAEWVFYLGGALLLGLGVVIRVVSRKK